MSQFKDDKKEQHNKFKNDFEIVQGKQEKGYQELL